MNKLHLGCGNVRIPGFINIDIEETEATDLCLDIRYLSGFNPETIDLIYACNVLEHFNKREIPKILKRWYEVLKPNGIIRLSVPDLENVFKYYLKTGDMEGIYSSIYGGQGKEYSFHYWGWDFKTLKKDLENCGFKKVRRYDRKQTEHANVRDWSENYLPQHTKKNVTIYYGKWIKGTNIALNVEATK